MSLRNRLILPVILSTLAVLVGCGGSSSSNNSVPPPSGGFSKTNFSGTYTFSTSGQDSNGALSIAGTITACGCSGGTISAATVDITDSAAPGANIAVDTSASGYNVNANGTGALRLTVPSSSGNVQFNFEFVLTDAAHGLIMESDTNGTGSGTIDLQPNPVTLATTPYAFSVSGADTAGALSLAGAFTLNSSGAVSTGIVDFNENATNVAIAQPLTGSMTVGSGTAPGTATLTFGSTSLTFDVYAIDATHLKLIATSSSVVLVGDVYSQPTATIPAGTLAFLMAGSIPSTAGASVFAVGGTVSSDGASALTSGAEDININGTVDNGANPATPYPFTGTFVADPSGSGRYQVALTGFQGGTNFAAYPSSGGVLMLEVEPSGTLNPGTTAGVAMAQNSPAGLVTSQGYGMNLTGAVSGGGELDQIAQFDATSTGVSGVLYQNNFGVSNPSNGNFSGTITAGSGGGGALAFNSNNEGVFYYGVDATTSMALGIDSSDVSLGVILEQGSPSSTTAHAKTDVAQRHLAMLKAAAKRRQTR